MKTPDDETAMRRLTAGAPSVRGEAWLVEDGVKDWLPGGERRHCADLSRSKERDGLTAWLAARFRQPGAMPTSCASPWDTIPWRPNRASMAACARSSAPWLPCARTSSAARSCPTRACRPSPGNGASGGRACAPYRARSKGEDERGSGHVKRSAVAGRSFMSFAGPEAHLDAWTREVADRREHALDLDRHRGVATRSQRKPPGAR